MQSRTTGSPRNISSTTPTPLSLLKRVSNFPRMACTRDLTRRQAPTIKPRGIMKRAETSAPPTSAGPGNANPQTSHPATPAPPVALPPNVAYDLTLQHPRCVFQLMKEQYSRYTPEMVERITGIPKEQYLKAIDLFTSVRKDGDMKKVATIIYAVGWTQHTFGTQII